MRTVLSNLISESAKNDENFLLLTGDHGYALFDEIRKTSPEKFVNVGIMEQALISTAAGLSKVGYKPLCYGLASFVPIRVLEQIKFDLCLSNNPVKIIGDGAGLIYTNLGNSHYCGEDMSVLSPLEGIEIYSPGDPEEMRICYKEFISSDVPAYLRVGKCDNPKFNEVPLTSTKPYFTNKTNSNEICLVSTGAMLGIANQFSKEFNVSHLSIMKIKTIDKEALDHLKSFKHIIFFEEHVRKGGLTSAVTDLFIDSNTTLPKVTSYSLKNSFVSKAGSHQYALSEHGLATDQLRINLKCIIDAK